MSSLAPLKPRAAAGGGGTLARIRSDKGGPALASRAAAIVLPRGVLPQPQILGVTFFSLAFGFRRPATWGVAVRGGAAGQSRQRTRYDQLHFPMTKLNQPVQCIQGMVRAASGHKEGARPLGGPAGVSFAGKAAAAVRLGVPRRFVL